MNQRLALLSAGLLLVPVAARADGPASAGAEFFEKQVRPLLAERCLKCHGDRKPKGGLRLTSRATILQGGDTGPAAVAGKPEKSLLIQAVHYQGDLRMPPKGKLADREVAVLDRWVRLGLPWPEVRGTVTAKGGTFEITEEQRRFWAFQKVKPVQPPRVRNAGWVKSDVDRFILARLEEKGLRPARPADKRTLIRRATFDLTGLPPTPAEVEAFLADQSPDAFARVVDRLLASPQYGEKWGRHWLDVVRYADSFDSRVLSGPGSIMDITEAWRYRDWVVNAFNRDLPYDQFLIDQIAGDLVPGPQGEVNAEGIVATGMLAIGNWGGGDADKEKLLTDIVDDQIDVVSKAFMGLTVTCARCHDHKFDPIAQKDYYGLAGIFFSTHILPDVGPKTNGPPMLRIPLLSKAELARREQYGRRLAELDRQLKEKVAEQYRLFARTMRAQTARYLLAAWDYQHRPAAEARLTAEEFASRRGLYPFALRQWLAYLGLGEYRLLAQPVRNVRGMAGVTSWRGAADCPNALFNSTSREASFLTIKLPPRSVAVHPGPSNGVAVAWRSPITGTVRITGRVADADPNGGDGIAWILDRHTPAGRQELASGEFPNGGQQALSAGRGSRNLTAVRVRAGERIELLVLPKANYTCDTTVVELVIAREDGSQVWDLSKDLLDDPLQDGKGNPHADRFGNRGVWSFLDMADVLRLPGTAHPALTHWLQALTSGPADRARLEAAAQAFQREFNLEDSRSPFWIRSADDARFLPEAARKELTALARELNTLRKNPPAPAPFANGAQEGGVPGSPQAGIHDVRVHIRGSYARLGDLVPRRFPLILAGEHQPPITRGSGRLQLARWLARPDHPLTARVMVNRIWQHHFGEGIVRTPSNFGKLGERPTHPELLDYLAGQFVRSGWSVKKMHRLIMLSAAYQQSSVPDPATLKADPDNRLLGRMSRRRLEAEEVRDSLLAVAGRLDLTQGGRATQDFNAPRRTLYLMTVRSERSGFRPLFDMPDSTAPVEKRTVSTVAPQALFLLNHPFILEQTRALAGRLLKEKGTEAERIGKAYLLLFGRPPTAAEARIGLTFLDRAAQADKARQTAWEEYCQVLLCTNEFIFVD